MTIVAMVSGFATTAFYWLPAMAEVSYSSVDRAVPPDVSPAQRLLLMPFDHLVQSQLLYQFGSPPFQLGLVEVVVAFCGLIAILAACARRHRQLLPVLILPVAAVLLACLMTSASLLFWEKVHVANSIQFAYRLLSLIGTFAAVCTGLLALPRRLGPYIAVAIGGALVLTATFSLAVSYEDVPDYGLSLGTSSRYQVTRDRPGLSHNDEWLPAVANLGASQSPQQIALLSRTTIERKGPLAYRFEVAADEATSLRFHAYAFPGWQAKVDGQASVINPSLPLGIVSVAVPSGSHTVDLWFADTPARMAGRLLSLASLLALAVILLARGRRWKAGHYLGLSLLVFVAILVGVDLIPRAPKAMGQELSLNGQRPMQVDFGQLIRLAGFELKSPSTEEGWQAEAVVYWQALRGEARDVTALFEWVDDMGVAVSASNGELVFGTAHLQDWLPNEVVRDVRRLVLPPRPLRNVRLRLTVSANGGELGLAELGRLDSLQAGPVVSNLAARPVLGDFAGIMGLVDFKVGREVLGKGSPSDSSGKLLATFKPGDEMQVNLWWRGLAASNEDYKVFVHLYNHDFQLLAQHDRQPGHAFGTTSLWQRGEIYQDPHSLAIPLAAKPGVYRLEVGAYQLIRIKRLNRADSDNSTYILGRIKVSPMSSATSPSNRLDATFGGALNLKGYETAVEKPDTVRWTPLSRQLGASS
ncbi:MAG: hypothetical protein Q7O66_18105 [Dehalococcoidia bacterium]|nr:hypothetical protein [Dehalococcoidia bacterium]